MSLFLALRSWCVLICLATVLLPVAFSLIIPQPNVRLQNSNGESTALSSSTRKECPPEILRCPRCPRGYACVYPDSGGCPNAGIPVCQPLACTGFVCMAKSLPCPDSCPFSCEYNGPDCCPFLGEPTCMTCNTFVPCAVTPCPEECPDDCVYPDADWCCPKSGVAVCRHKFLNPTRAGSNHRSKSCIA